MMDSHHHTWYLHKDGMHFICPYCRVTKPATVQEAASWQRKNLSWVRV